MYGLINVFATQQFEFAVFDGCYVLCYCLQRAENCTNSQINQLVQFLNLICANGGSFYELTRMLMSINVNNDVGRFAYFSSSYSESVLEEEKYIYEILYLHYRSISIPMVF